MTRYSDAYILDFDDISFRNPPINEVVMGCYFAPLNAFRAQHIGLFWADIADSFPKSVQAPPLGELAYTQDHEEFFPMQRFWLISQDETKLIQLQKNAFLFNWRRRPDKENYPRFHAILEEYISRIDHFRTFAQDTLNTDIDEIERAELTYINLIDLDAGDTIDQIERYIPGLRLFKMPSQNHSLTGFSMNTRYEISDTIRLDVSLRNGKLAGQDYETFYFELKATGKPKHPKVQKIDRWFQDAHDHVQEAFFRITSEGVWSPNGLASCHVLDHKTARGEIK